MIPPTITARPTYRIWDTLHRRWYEPTHRFYAGEVEELALLPNGELVLRTLHGVAHESTFPGRFIVVPLLDHFTASAN